MTTITYIVISDTLSQVPLTHTRTVTCGSYLRSAEIGRSMPSRRSLKAIPYRQRPAGDGVVADKKCPYFEAVDYAVNFET